MKKKPASKSAFFNRRVLIGFSFCLLGLVLALLAFAAYPGGNAFARQEKATAPAGIQQNATEPPAKLRATLAMVEDVQDVDSSIVAPMTKDTARPDVIGATFVVNTTNDTVDAAPGDGVCLDGAGACSLRAAISEANALAGADTITLPAGTYTTTLLAANEDLNAGGDFDVRSDLTINGAGSGTTIIQANTEPNMATEKVIHITTGSGTVNINNVTIRHGNSTVNTLGGGVRIDAAGSVTNLTNVIITANKVSLAGNCFAGGLGITAGTVTLTGCTVSNNSAVATTTGFNGFAGGIYNQQATLHVVNSTLTGNFASSFHGGIRTLASTTAAAITNITNSSINNNQAQGQNNTASGGPGEGGGVVNIAGSTFGATTNITGSTINGNAAQVLGVPGVGTSAGGVENFHTNTGAAIVNITNSTISGNTAEIAGGVYSDGTAAQMNIKYSTIASNAATGSGGGLYQNVTAGGITNLKSSIVADNTSTTAGNQIFGTITSQNYNHIEGTAGGTFAAMANDVVAGDPALGALANNGGPTFTHLPGGASVVLNTIPSGTNECGTTVAVDQRALVRPGGAACDKGSVEVQVGPTPTPSPTVTPGGPTPTPTPTPTQTPTPTPTPTLPVIISPLVATGTVGLPFTYQFEASGATSLAAGNLAPGLTFNTNLRAITGIPTTAGIFQVALSATNSAGTTNATLTLTVQMAPPSGPVIVSSTAATGRTGRPFSFQLRTIGSSSATRFAVENVLPPGFNLDPLTGFISGTPTSDGNFSLAVSAIDGTAITRGTVQLTFTSNPTVPIITSPATAMLTPGQFFTYPITADANGIFGYIGSDGIVHQAPSPSCAGLPAGLCFDGDHTISGTFTPPFGSDRKSPRPPDQTGGIITNVELFGSGSGGTGILSEIYFLEPTGAGNIATRLAVGTGENVLIGGFIIEGNAPKKVVIRALGPSLTQFGVPNAMADPVLDLNEGNVLLSSNDNWRDNPGQANQIIATQLQPSDDREAAILAYLNPGPYTALVRGKNNSTGNALVEVYDLGTAILADTSKSRLANIATRGTVLGGDSVMIGGFIIRRSDTRMVVRAIGPSLTAFGISGALQDPTLELKNANGVTLIGNDDWESDPTQAAEIQQRLLAPSHPRESALVRTLAPGQYTAVVSGKGGATGVAVVEGYALAKP